MPIIIPISAEPLVLVTHTFAALFSASIRYKQQDPALAITDIGLRLDPTAALSSASITTGEGTVVIVDAISSILDSAR